MYVIIEGCVGSGKTTVSKLLSVERGCSLVLENFQANPFIDKFYMSASRYALETELAFVLIHYHQILHEIDSGEGNDFIADFSISKDLLFAEMNLKGGDLNIFKNLYFPLLQRLPDPDIMICLRCSGELILDRIKQRRQGSEHRIDSSYFLELNRRYDSYFAEMKTAKIEVNMDEINFLTHPEEVARLSSRIDKIAKQKK